MSDSGDLQESIGGRGRLCPQVAAPRAVDPAAGRGLRAAAGRDGAGLRIEEGPYSTLAPDTSTTCAHLAISARRYLSNAAGSMIMETAPCSAQIFCRSGRLMIFTTSALSRSTIGLGVAAGAI